MTSGAFYMPEDRRIDGFMWSPCVRLRRLWFSEKTSKVCGLFITWAVYVRQLKYCRLLGVVASYYTRPVYRLWS